MGMNSVSKGRRNQRRCADWLREQGYCVEVARFSRWGSTDFFNLFDIIAVGGDEVRLIQVKTNRREGVELRKRISAFVVPECVKKEVWIYYDRKKEPRIIILCR